MEPLFTCPPPTALPSIPSQDCPEVWEQIDTILFQRIPANGEPSFTETTILDQATWTPLMTASDNTKAIKSPLLPNFIIPPSEALTEGGNDNTGLNGIPRFLGHGFVTVTFDLYNRNAAVRNALASLAAQTASQPGETLVWAYFVNRFKQIVAGEDGSGIPVYNFNVGDPGTEGYNKYTIAKGSFHLPAGWSKGLKLFTPTFDPHKL